MDNEEKAKIVNELYGSVHDPHNYDEKYYYQQAKETAAVTAIAMLRDSISPADIKICIESWYGVTIPDHAMRILQAEATSDEEIEALTGNRITNLSPSGRHNRCWRARKVRRMCKCGVSPNTIHSIFPELSEEEINYICSSIENNNTGARVDNLTLRKLHEMTTAPLKTTAERVAYLRGRGDKTREVIQNLYCNHGGNAHPVYDFFQDSEIGYEEIIGWKQEAADYMERQVKSRIARRAAVQMLQDGQEPNRVKETIEKWFSVRFSDSQMVTLRRQVNLNKCMSEITIESHKENKNNA